MKRPRLQTLTVDQLIENYAAIGVEQYEALDADNTAKYNRLFDQKQEIEEELKRRAGDQRRALISLYNYPNMQVRLNAAKATLAVAPQAARQLVETIAASTWPPQCYDAGMCLEMLDQGKFVPE
jgi:hypothetical protein